MTCSGSTRPAAGTRCSGRWCQPTSKADSLRRDDPPLGRQQVLDDRARRRHGLIQELREEAGDVRGCGLQNREDVVHDVGRRGRLREDQPHDERDEEEPDDSPHGQPPFCAGSRDLATYLYRTDRIGGIQRAGRDGRAWALIGARRTGEPGESDTAGGARDGRETGLTRLGPCTNLWRESGARRRGRRKGSRSAPRSSAG